MESKGRPEGTVSAGDGSGLYRALMRCSSDGLILLRRESGLITEANEAAGVMARQSDRALAGRHLVDLVESQDIERVSIALREARRDGSALVDFSLVRPEGAGPRPVSAHLETIGDESMLVILHDITEKARLLEMVRREKQLTRSLLEAVNASVLGTDRKGQIKFMNRKFRETVGVETSAVLGRDAIDTFVVESDRVGARAAHEMVLAHGIVEELDLRIVSGDTERILSFTGALVGGGMAPLADVVWVAIDVTNTRHIMEDVRRREERTQRSLQQLKEFSRVSGEILQEPDLDRVCKTFVEAIRDVSTFNRAILTLCDEDFRGYQWYFAGLSEEEIEVFHKNKLTSRERVTIFQERFRLGNSYYVPHEEDWYYEGVRSHRDSEVMIDWHPDDFLFIPLFGAHRKIVGIVSVDDPVDGRRPTAESISPLELFAHQVAHAIEEKKLALEVKKTGDRYRTLVQTMNDGLFTVDLSERITFLNPALLELTGHKRTDLLGQSLSVLMPEDSVVEFRNRTRIREVESSRFELEIFAKDGSRIPVLVSATPYLQQEQKKGSFAIISDLREQKQAEQERQRMHEEVVRANIKLSESMAQLQSAQEQLIQAEKLSALGELISGVAHELNNPLTGVMGYAQLLMRADAPEEVRKILERINKEAVRCQKIVQNLLVFARHHRPERSPVVINDVLRSTLELRAYQLKVDNIEVEIDLQEEMSAVLGDAYQIQQVFINIINNAHHAMLETDRPGKLVLRTRQRAETIRVEFIDNGPGIAEDKIGKIFDPFFTTKEMGRGTGLGLSLSYGIIKEHEGQIRVESRPGQGATFLVEFPAHKESDAVPSPPQPEDRAKVRPPEGRILVVDDEETILELLLAILEAAGHQVDTAGNGRLALEKIKANDYDLIISDLKMPDMGGQKLYESIREIKPDLVSRMIFSTGDTVSPATRAFFRDTGNPYIAKPFTLEEVDALVTRVLLKGQ